MAKAGLVRMAPKAEHQELVWMVLSQHGEPRARLARKAGNQVQVEGNVILAPNWVIWAKDTNLTIIYREMVTNWSQMTPSRQRERERLCLFKAWWESPRFYTSQKRPPLAIITRVLFTYTSTSQLSQAHKLFSSWLNLFPFTDNLPQTPSSACLLVWTAYWLAIIHSVNSLSICNYDFSWFIWGLLGTSGWGITWS